MAKKKKSFTSPIHQHNLERTRGNPIERFSFLFMYHRHLLLIFAFRLIFLSHKNTEFILRWIWESSQEKNRSTELLKKKWRKEVSHWHWGNENQWQENKEEQKKSDLSICARQTKFKSIYTKIHLNRCSYPFTCLIAKNPLKAPYICFHTHENFFRIHHFTFLRNRWKMLSCFCLLFRFFGWFQAT